RGRPENVDSATLRGLSLAGAWDIDRTTLSARIDLQNPRDDATGNQLSRRARHIYGADVTHRLHDWTLAAEYRYVGRRYDDAANRHALGGYSLWHLAVRYDITKNFSAHVRWNNVFNKD